MTKLRPEKSPNNRGPDNRGSTVRTFPGYGKFRACSLIRIELDRVFCALFLKDMYSPFYTQQLSRDSTIGCKLKTH